MKKFYKLHQCELVNLLQLKNKSYFIFYGEKLNNLIFKFFLAALGVITYGMHTKRVHSQIGIIAEKWNREFQDWETSGSTE
jgi:hypothetical protein